MADAGKTPNTDQTEKQEHEHKRAEESTVDRNANKAAKRAEKREKEYDQNHDIFTK